MMKRKIWMLGTLICLVICLAAGYAMADGNKTKPDWRSVENPRIVEKGEMVTISTGTGSGYEAIKLVIKDTNGWTVTHTEVKNVSAATNGKLSFSFSTSAFTAEHLYLTELMALPTVNSDPEKWDGYWDSVLTVVPADTTGLQLYLNKTEIETGYGGFYVTAYDPDAENVWIVLDGEAFQSRPGNNMTWVEGYEDPGSHTVKAISIDANGNKTYSQEKTITTVKYDTPELYSANETPVTFTMGGVTKPLSEFPETITAGTGISYTIHRVTKDLGKDAAGLDQQVRYDSWLDDPTNWDLSMELPCYEKRYEPEVPHGLLMNDDTGDRTITIDPNHLVTGHTYRLHVEIRSAGRTSVKYEKIFTVLPATMNNEGITLSFTGDAAGQSSIDYPMYEGFGLRASVPVAAEGATLVRFWDGYSYNYLNNWLGGEWPSEGSFTFDWKTWGTGENKYFIQAYYGEIGETPWDQLNWDAALTSNILTVNAIKNSTETVYPTYSVLSDTVTQGDYFTVTLTNSSSELNRGDVYFGADLYNGNDIENHYDRTGNQIKVPTADLLPGYYILAIYTETNGAGYVQNPHCFRVVANQNAPESGFIITTTVPAVNGVRTVESYERFSVTFFAPDREGYNKYYRFFDGQSYWWDNWFERSVTLEADLDPGTWEIYAEAVYEPEDESQDEIRIESEHIQITATSRGDSHILLEAPGSYTIGNNGYIVSIKNTQNDRLIDPEQYNDVYWELVLEEAHGPELMRFQEGWDALQSSFTFPNGLFEAGKTYRARLHLNVPGYDPVDDEVCFVAVDPQAINQQKLELAVNELNTGSYVAWYPAHTTFNVKVTKSSDITAVRVLNGDNWEIWWGDDDYQRDWGFGTGIYGLVAQGTTDDPVWEEDGFDWSHFDWNEDVNWSITSNTVTVRINAPNGKLGRPTLTLDKADKIYTRGEKITATVGKADGSEWYDLHVSTSDEYGNEQGGWVYDTRMDTTGTGTFTFTVPTDHMEPGLYVVWVDNNGNGYQGNGSSRILFTVTQGSQEPTAVLELPATINTNQNINIYAYVPNADDIWLDIRKQGDPGWHQDRNNGGNYAEWEFGEGFKGTYLFTLFGHVDGEKVLAAGPAALEVKADNGDLNDVTISPNTRIVTIGQSGASGSISGTFTKDSRAEWYQVRLVYRGPEGEWPDNEIRSSFRDGENIGTGFTYDITDFKRTGVYEIQVIGGATGYNGTHNTVKILAVETADGTIGLTINGNNGSQTGVAVQANENMNIQINAPGATAIRLFEGNRWEWWDGRCLDEDGGTRFDWSLNSGEYVFVAQAAYDEGYDWEEFDDWQHFDPYKDLHWTAISNEVHVSVTASGVTDAPVIANIGTVTRGELLGVTVTSAGSENSPTRATSLDAFIQHENGWNTGEGIGTGNLETTDYPYTFQFPTGNMEPGRYYVYVHSHAQGYDTGEAYAAFEIAEPDEDDSFVFEIQDGLYADMEFSMSAYAEGASWIDVYLQEEENDQPFTWGPFEGDHIYNTRSRLNGGCYEIWAVAHYTDQQGNETGIRTSERITREVRWLGSLDNPVIDSLGSYSTSTGGSFTVSNLDQNCYWWVELFDMDVMVEYEGGNMGWERIAEWNADGGLPASFPNFPISIQDLVAGHSYRINAHVRQDGYEEGYDWKEFIAIGEASNNVVLTVETEAGYELDHWPSSKNINMTINAPGASAIRFWNGNNWECRDSRCVQNDGKYHEGVNINDEGQYTLVAQACYDRNIDGSSINWDAVDFSQFDWNTMQWADMSNAVSVTIYANGQLNEATYTAPAAVQTGDDIVITITNPVQDQWYNAVVRQLDRRNVTNYIPMEEGNTIIISTEGIEGGVYMLCVWTDAEGMLGCESNRAIVIDDLSEASVFTLPAGITEVEEDAFDGVRMDVVVIQGNHPSLDLSFLNNTGTRYLVASEGSVTVPRSHTYEVISPEQFNILK